MCRARPSLVTLNWPKNTLRFSTAFLARRPRVGRRALPTSPPAPSTRFCGTPRIATDVLMH
ncbi:hypothetical protein B0H10DRAFT_1980557 [Mycena sp. CBHHK59/15]|nr:hypothetical protein B0H10DRAFT_2053160 [Mycena sp. CBHHK59/15]KAJ6631041.1 hypothetical protein B0H10DRAFT_1980557 [Mycena sp. CBHHK59/15]